MLHIARETQLVRFVPRAMISRTAGCSMRGRNAKKVFRFNPEGLGQPINVVDRDVATGLLDRADVGTMQARLGGEFGLREAKGVAQIDHVARQYQTRSSSHDRRPIALVSAPISSAGRARVMALSRD